MCDLTKKDLKILHRLLIAFCDMEATHVDGCTPHVDLTWREKGIILEVISWVINVGEDCYEMSPKDFGVAGDRHTDTANRAIKRAGGLTPEESLEDKRI